MDVLLTTRSDGELLRRAATDSEAFAVLYRRHETVVASFLVRQVRDAEVAADLTSETFARALIHAGRFADTGQSCVGWLLGIARHQALHWFRRRRVDERARVKLGLERVSYTDESLRRLEELAHDTELAGRLNEAMQKLPASEREAIVAYVLEERPYGELARELGIQEAAVRKRVSRGLSRLRATTQERS